MIQHKENKLLVYNGQVRRARYILTSGVECPRFGWTSRVPCLHDGRGDAGRVKKDVVRAIDAK